MTTTRTRRWRLAAAGIALAATSFGTAACGSDVVDDGVEQEVEDAGNEVEEEVENTDRDSSVVASRCANVVAGAGSV